VDPNLSQNGEYLADTTTVARSGVQEQSSAQHGDDAGAIESDDGDSSWTDISSDGDVSSSSGEDSASDSVNNSKKVSGKRRSQHSHSASNVHICNGEKLVRIVYYRVHFYRAMHVVLARYCYRKSSVRLSVRPSLRL